MTTKPEGLFTQMLCLKKHVFYLMEANERNFLDYVPCLKLWLWSSLTKGVPTITEKKMFKKKKKE